MIDTALDALELPSGQRQDWAVRVLDRDERTMAMLKYNKGTNGETSWILAEVTYTSEGTQDWAQLQIGHRADGTRFIDAQAPFRVSSTANFLQGLTVSGAKAIFNHDIDANGALNVTKTLTAKGALSVTGAATFSDIVTASEGITSAKGITVQNGDVTVGQSGKFSGTATVNFAHIDTVIVNGQAPSGEQQRWPLAVYDKNNDALAYCKFTMRTTGTKEWAFCVAHPKSNGSGNNLGGLVVTCDADGKYGTIGVTADASSNSTDLATTFWVRRYIWTASESKLVHTVNDETIAGTKTFTYAIRGSATTLIQSVPWDGISIADTSRESTQNRMLCVVLDKDDKRFAGIEVSATTSGQRDVHITMRRRDDSGWVSPFKATELPDGTTYCEGAHHPPAGDVSYKFATTGWVEDRIGSTIPAGAICYFAQKSIPSGWLLCNGSNVSRTTYARLFAAIGTSWGSGDGRTTFKLPNLHAKFAQGTTTTSEVGQSVEAGLPNITGAGPLASSDSPSGSFTGAFSKATGSLAGGISEGGSVDANVTFDASASNALYGAASTVQPPAVRLLPCIKY